MVNKSSYIFGGLIAVVFTAILGTVYFYPYYIGYDNCVGGSWENRTEEVYFNETFPRIARYYCAAEAEISWDECLEMDRLLNVKGCKWGGKTSKRNSAGNQYRLYVMEDPELPIEQAEGKVTYYDDAIKTELPNGKSTLYGDRGGIYNESGVIKTSSEVDNLLEAKLVVSNKRAWGCNILEDNDTGVKCNSLKAVDGNMELNVTITANKAGSYPIKITTYNSTSEKEETEEIQEINALADNDKFDTTIEFKTLSDQVHIGEASTTINLSTNATGGCFNDTTLRIPAPTDNRGLGITIIGDDKDWIGIYSTNLSCWVSDKTIEGFRFNSYTDSSAARDRDVYSCLEFWVEGAGTATGYKGNASYWYPNSTNLTLGYAIEDFNWSGCNRSIGGLLTQHRQASGGDVWAKINFTNTTALQEMYDLHGGWMSWTTHLAQDAGGWFQSKESAIAVWNFNLTVFTPPLPFELNIVQSLEATYWDADEVDYALNVSITNIANSTSDPLTLKADHRFNTSAITVGTMASRQVKSYRFTNLTLTRDSVSDVTFNITAANITAGSGCFHSNTIGMFIPGQVGAAVAVKENIRILRTGGQF